MVQDLSIAGTLLLSGWCLFVRRASWRCKLKRAVTLSIAFTALGVILTSPELTRYDDSLLIHSIGIHHFDDYIGHILFFSAVCAVSYALLARLVPDRYVRGLMLRRVEYPAGAAALIMLVMVALSPRLGDPRGTVRDNFFDVPCGWYLHAYWAVYTGTMIYLFAYLMRLLWVLRRDTRSRLTANLYLAGSALGIVACVCEFLDTWLHFMDGWLWLLLTAPGLIAAFAAARSWRLQLHDNETEDFPTPPNGRKAGPVPQ